MSKTKKAPKRRYTFLLSSDLLERLEAAAQAEESTVSALLREGARMVLALKGKRT